MAYTTIDDPSAYFQTALYTGNGGSSTQVVTNDGNSDLQPDWIWLKNRTSARWNLLNDSTRGASYNLYSNEDDPEDVGGSGGNTSITSFNSDGFTLATDTGDGGWNEQGDSHVAWQWKANGGTTTTNDASSTGVGTIDSVYQANTTAGFSIVTHTGSGSAGNIAHGLGAVPEWIVTKNRTDDGQSWANYHVGVGNAYYLELDTTDAKETASSVWGDTTPSSTTFRVGGANGKNNASSKNYVTYCFTSIQGYSKFGSFEGNNNADGPFVYTGFKPAWIMIKNIDAAKVWFIWDNARDTFNVANHTVEANANSAEANTGTGATNYIDMLSNGFKVRQTGSHLNPDSETVIYMAFAESPFVSSEGVPTTAR